MRLKLMKSVGWYANDVKPNANLDWLIKTYIKEKSNNYLIYTPNEVWLILIFYELIQLWKALLCLIFYNNNLKIMLICYSTRNWNFVHKQISSLKIYFFASNANQETLCLMNLNENNKIVILRYTTMSSICNAIYIFVQCLLMVSDSLFFIPEL